MKLRPSPTSNSNALIKECSVPAVTSTNFNRSWDTHLCSISTRAHICTETAKNICIPGLKTLRFSNPKRHVDLCLFNSTWPEPTLSLPHRISIAIMCILRTKFPGASDVARHLHHYQTRCCRISQPDTTGPHEYHQRAQLVPAIMYSSALTSSMPRLAPVSPESNAQLRTLHGLVQSRPDRQACTASPDFPLFW